MQHLQVDRVQLQLLQVEGNLGQLLLEEDNLQGHLLDVGSLAAGVLQVQEDRLTVVVILMDMQLRVDRQLQVGSQLVVFEVDNQLLHSPGADCKK